MEIVSDAAHLLGVTHRVELAVDAREQRAILELLIVFGVAIVSKGIGRKAGRYEYSALEVATRQQRRGWRGRRRRRTPALNGLRARKVAVPSRDVPLAGPVAVVRVDKVVGLAIGARGPCAAVRSAVQRLQAPHVVAEGMVGRWWWRVRPHRPRGGRKERDAKGLHDGGRIHMKRRGLPTLPTV